MVSVRFLPWLMWGLTTSFFAYQFIMRLAPGLVMPELMQKFSIEATDYGLFAAAYYFAYAGMQIPVALLLDRFGPRRVISLSALACALGTLLLVYTNQWELALFSRFLIGAGSAAGFLGTSKIIATWFPEKWYTKMIGLTFTFGLIGAVYGGKPVGSLITKFGWVDVLALVGFVGLAIAGMIALVLRNPKENNPHSPNAASCREPYREKPEEAGKTAASVFSKLTSILSHKKLLLIALANFLMVGALEGFADVWGVSYLSTTRGMLKEEAAQLISMIFVGMLFGGPILAYCADKLRSNYWITSAAGLFMGLIFVVMLTFNTQLELGTLYVMLFFTGIFCCYQVLIFSMGVNLVSKELASLTVAFLNCINMLGGSFFHSLIGHCMDLFWRGGMENVVRVYDSYAYTCALSSIAIAAVLGSLLLYFVRPRTRASDYAYQV